MKSTIIEAPVERVWEVLRDFNGHDQWHPAVADSVIERSLPADKVGCVRRFHLADGSELREQLLTLSDADMAFTYCLLDTPIPLFNYVAHVRLAPVTDGDATFWHWESRFDTPAGREEELAHTVGRNIYEGGFARDPGPPRPRRRRAGGRLMALRVETVDRIEEAARLLQADRNARLMGGGTLVMRGVNAATPSLETLVVVRRPDREIRPAGGRIEIGAGVTMAGIMASSEVSFLAPAARVVGGPAVRAAATVGGNLFARPPFGEFTTALLALGAAVNLNGNSAPVPLEEFLRDRGRDHARIVQSVSVPRPADPQAFRFVKVTRVKPKGAPVFSIAAYVPAAGGRIAGARIAISNMGPAPARAIGAERALEGQPLDEQSVSRAAAAMLEGLAPLHDEMASEWYRREVAPVHLRRLLLGRER